MLTDGQREAVLAGTASWFEPGQLKAAWHHARACPECRPGTEGRCGPEMSTRTMCAEGRRVAIGSPSLAREGS